MIVECVDCQAIVDAEVLESYMRSDPEYGPPDLYSFLRCPRCNGPFMVAQQELWEDTFDDPVRLYPPQTTKIYAGLPKTIKAAYEEAVSCFRARAFTATAIMCRKILEGLCQEHGVRERNLVASLKALRDNGVIETRLFEWADALRIFGNEAAHEVSVTVSAEDARDILEFTNALLEYVFTFRDRFERFKQRRAASSAPANGA